MFKAILFDRDGVIIDTEPINISSAVKAFQIQNINITDEEKKMIIGVHPCDYREIFEKKYDFDFGKYREDKRAFYLAGQKTAPLFKEVIKLIKQLHKKKIPLALVTSSRKNGTLQIIKKIGLSKVFSAIVTFEDCAKRKPASDCYLVAAKRLGVKPQECLVFEDTAIGVMAAKKAGMTCYALPNKTTKHQDFSLADKVIKNKKDLNIDLLK